MISVVIPAYGPTPHLREVLNAIKTGTRVPDEIVVSHSGTDDPSDWIAAEYPEVACYHSEERMFAGRARNKGAARTTSPMLAFCDCDTVPARDWVERIEAFLQSHEGAFLVGSVGTRLSGGYWGMATWHCEFSEQSPHGATRNQTGGASCNMGIRTADLAAVGGFPEDFRAGQDTMLFYRLRKDGREQVFDPAIRVDHCNIAGFGHFARHLFNQGRHFAKLRLHAALPGGTAVRFWPIAPLLGPYKAILVARRLAATRRLKDCLLYFPGILLGSLIFGTGCTYAAATRRFTGRY